MHKTGNVDRISEQKDTKYFYLIPVILLFKTKCPINIANRGCENTSSANGIKIRKTRKLLNFKQRDKLEQKKQRDMRQQKMFAAYMFMNILLN